jgi:putative ABC transport system ATP-binding protein
VLFELQELRVSRAGRLILDGFSARIPEGATAVVGPSGSGKSSLLRLLNRLADPDSGRILFRGSPLVEFEVLALRREVMLVPQLPALLPGTVGDNIGYAARLAGRDGVDLQGPLRAAGLDATYADREAAKLSVGEQQRAMLARALAAEPGVLLLDEPTSALDPDSIASIEQALAGLRRRGDLSLVLVTHDRAQAARLADRAIRLAAAPSEAGERAPEGAR